MASLLPNMRLLLPGYAGTNSTRIPVRVTVHLAGTMRQPVQLELESRDEEWITGRALDGVRHKINRNSIARIEEVRSEALPRLGRRMPRRTVH